MSNNFEKLKKVFAEIFQMDQADLDFGIYRIINQKRDEISRFLEKDLLPQVKEAFSKYKPADKAEIQQELDKAIQQAINLGANPDDLPKVKELRIKLASSVDLTALEEEVFSHLTSFFRRYYDRGDFISQRRYKEGVYAIPYEGEEVKLYWANYDQYYTKSSETFRDYAFKIQSGKQVRVHIVAASTEIDNNKAAPGKERRFVLSDDKPLIEENGELYIRFEYRPLEGKEKQDVLNQQAIDTILKMPGFDEWLQELSKLVPTDKKKDRTVLEKHLTDYTARNTFDYFIHKNLGRFLGRELDFYVKNEIMHLDDIENESAPRVEQYLSMIKAVRLIALKIITFLAQIEDFQKKLWLKKKFVVETNYCVTLDRVPAELYPEIIANDSQREEWIKLFAIDEINCDPSKTAYAVLLNIKFLKENPFLVLDTKFFGEEFKTKLLASFDNLDEQMDGLLIHSENFQALNLLQERYRRKVKCVYIDPPYNAKSSEIIYKNSYKHSSWLSLMADRIGMLQTIQSSDGCLVVAVDENEQERLGLLLEAMYPNALKTCVSVIHNPGGIQGDNFSYCHESAYFIYPGGKEVIGKVVREEADEVPLRDWGGDESKRETAANCFYPIFVKDMQVVGFGDVCPDEFHPSSANLQMADGLTAVYPVDGNGIERKWRHARITVVEILKELFCKQNDGLISVIRKKSVYRYKTVWQETKYNANTNGSKLLGDILGGKKFSFPKSIYTVADSIEATTQKNPNCVVIDCFGGSGTTGHATIHLNREHADSRKYILVEMGEYFDTVMKPRIQKVIYSKDWKDGKPVSREGSSHMFKYIRLESYEDTLNNLELTRSNVQEALISESSSFKESYMLSYMLDVESKKSLLNISMFEDPFNHKLKIATESAGETKVVTVDLVETFNYLIGLTVHHIDHIQGYRVVQGLNPKGEKTLVIWRNTKEKSNENLEKFFRKQDYNPKDMEFAVIYVNGDNNLENIKRDDETWKVRLIEEEFKRLMFDIEEI